LAGIKRSDGRTAFAGQAGGKRRDLTQCYRQICQLALEDLPVVGSGCVRTLLYDSAIKGIGSVHYTSLFANIDDWHRVEP
jgi:hypothetical protein